jgi:DNA-binding LacI/PurR family transcriptional regulator
VAPRDFSLASADFYPHPLTSSPAITSAGSNPEKLGETAAEFLAQLATQKPSTRVVEMVIPAQFLIGDTTGPVPKAVRPTRSKESAWTRTIAA